MGYYNLPAGCNTHGRKGPDLSFLLTMFLIYFVFAVVGLMVGSFLNVVILRGARGETLSGRSYCYSCKKILSAVELIPVVSFLVQKGRCRSCAALLDRQYLAVELLTAALFAFASIFILKEQSWNFESMTALVGILGMLSAFMVILVSDLKYRIIPNGAALALSLIGAARILLEVYRSSLLRQALFDVSGALVLSLFIAALWFVSGGHWMGLGDAKLLFGTSLIIGFPQSAVAFLIAFWAGTIVGLVLLLTKKSSLKDTIPFGPFILFGTAYAYFFWYPVAVLLGLHVIV